MHDSERIGDPGREKWSEFLSIAFEQGYLTKDEFEERITVVQNAKYMDEIRTTHAGMENRASEFSKEYNKLREKGLRSKTEIHPRIPPGTVDNYHPSTWAIIHQQLTPAYVLIGIAVIFFILTLTNVIQ